MLADFLNRHGYLLANDNGSTRDLLPKSNTFAVTSFVMRY
jgi:hypothetical protein